MKRSNQIGRVAVLLAAMAILLTGMVFARLPAQGAPAASGGSKAAHSGVDRLYVLDCGVGHAADQSRWSMGVNIGKPIDISVKCYLIRHSQGYFLWDTGISDHVASMKDGWLRGTNPAVDIHWRRAKTLMSQLAEIKVAPADIRNIGISHTHPDHIGNAELFPKSTILIQKAEHDFFLRPAAEGAQPVRRWTVRGKQRRSPDGREPGEKFTSCHHRRSPHGSIVRL